MAKLEGVKVLNTVNGEITKVEYDGDVYVKTDDTVKEGDLFQLREGNYVIGGEANAFYSTKIYDDGDVVIPTKMIGNATYAQLRGTGVAFRKIYDSKPSIETRVDDLEERVKALENPEEPRKLKAGDFIKFKESSFGITAGKVYEVITYEDGDLVVKDDNGFHDNGINLGKEYEIVSADEAKWAKLGRSVNEYKVGDIIEITRYQYGDKVGSIVKVTSDIPKYSAVEYRSISGKSTYAADYDAIKLVAPVESTM